MPKFEITVNGAVITVEAESAKRLLDVLREDLVNAAHLCQTTPAPGLRTPDALHLAIAQRLRYSMVTFDQALASACGLYGVACRSIH